MRCNEYVFDRLGSLLKVFDDGRALMVGATKPYTEDNNRSYVAKGTKPFVVLCGLIECSLKENERFHFRFNPNNYVIFLEQAAG